MEVAPPVQAPEQSILLETPTGTLHGSLLLPANPAPVPLVLIHVGSGPTDRDGNSALLPGGNDGLKLLAEALAERGIASLRYDKRGVAASLVAGPTESALRLDTYVDDAVAWIHRLRGDARFRSLSVLGHSEGSLIGMLAAERAQADGFISVTAPGRRASDILRDQLRPQLTDDLWQQSEHILLELEDGRTVADVPPTLMSLYRPSVQPYLISWFRYVPAEEIQRVPAPVLVLFGSTDLQVAPTEAAAFRQARPEAEVVVIEGMNHVLKLVPPDPIRQNASYSDPSLPVAPELIERIAAFIGSLSQ